MSGWQWNGLVQTRTVGSPTRKAVLMFLADVASEDGRSFYGVGTMAAALELGEKTVRRALNEFEADGVLTRERVRRDDGTLSTYTYVLLWDGIARLPWNGLRSGGRDTDPFATPPVTDDRTTGHPVPAPPVTQSSTTGHSDRAEPSVVTPRSEPTEEPPSSLSDDVDSLCADLSDRVAQQRDGARPPVTERWRKDMRLLLERGPLDQDHPEPQSVEKVQTTIAYVFDQMAEPEGRGGFCWADQIRSPAALRKHWHQMAQAARASRRARRGPVERAVERMGGTALPLDSLFAMLPRNQAASAGARRALGG